MKQLFVVFFLLGFTVSYAQSYVDLGIRHFAVGEYEEALIDFKEAEEIESMITESSKAKMYYYRGMIWLMRAEKSAGDFAEEDPIRLSFEDLSTVISKNPEWTPQIEEAYERLYPLIIKEADSYLKFEKKEKDLNAKLQFLDQRIAYLTMAQELEVSAKPVLYLGQTNKQAGDLIFEESSNVGELQKAKNYYETALIHYEQARYEDPFSKEIIQDLLSISKRLMDVDRISEYEKLLQLAGG
ncbi:hypothetical protein [Ekhidna sp. To15]|uniref:hypothetical protein n=1 Tax=Ekhidna sp. To15 TaxID=3395267 RepID=UPI003F51F789